MKKILTYMSLFVLVVGTMFVTGCKTITSTITPAVVQEGVQVGVGAGITEYPTAIPYLQAVTPIICSAANGTNFDPAQVIAAIDNSSEASAVETPDAVLILNGALVLYTGIYDSYIENSVTNSAELQLYLQATCNGLTAALPPVGSTNAVSSLKTIKPTVSWPLVPFKK